MSPCCCLLDGAVLPANSVTAPFSIWAGSPAVQVGKLPESFQIIWQEHTRRFYKHFVPLAPTTAATTATATAAAAARPPASSAAAPAVTAAGSSSTDMPLPPTPGQS